MTAPQGVVRTEFVVAPDTARTVARAVVRYRLTSVSALGPLLILAGLVLVTGVGGVVWLAVAEALAIVVIVAAAFAGIPRLTRTLQARGFRPGTTVTVDWADADFTVTTPSGHAVHAYADVRSVRVFGRVVAIRLNPARLLVVLPTELVPGEALRRLPAG